MSIGVRHKGHPFPIPVTVSAHAEQKRAWPHGTNATRSRGTNSQSSHISVTSYVADVDVDVDVDIADATSSSVPSSLFGCEISSESTCVTTARCAQKLHSPPRMVSLMTDSPQRNHPTMAICFTVRTPSKTRGHRFPCMVT